MKLKLYFCSKSITLSTSLIAVMNYHLYFYTFLYSVLVFTSTTNAQTVTTLAGSVGGNEDGVGTSARFSSPVGVAVSADGTVYVADSGNHRIRKVSADGTVTTLAGSTQGYADGVGTSAKFNFPTGVSVSTDGTIYVADFGNHRIRKVSADGVVSTIVGSTQGYADGVGMSAQFNNPSSVGLSSDGSLYVTDMGNHLIRNVSVDGAVTTFAGSKVGNADGIGTDAQFNFPYSIAISNNRTAYVADLVNNRIRNVSSDGKVTTQSGSIRGYNDGVSTEAQFSSPSGVAVSSDGVVYVVDSGNHRIRKVNTDGMVSTLAGSTQGNNNGEGALAQFNNPSGIAVSSDGTMYIADRGNNCIRKITHKLTSVEIITQSRTSLMLSPNPASDILRITMQESRIVSSYEVYDYLGTFLLSGTFDQSKDVDISALSTGMYFMRIGTSMPTKFIKQ